MNFVAIDFETANYLPGSACALGVVKVVDDMIVDKAVHLIKPPTKEFVFTYIHGLTWKDVAKVESRLSGEIWSKVELLLCGAEFLAAHNAAFDKRVLQACCATYGITDVSTAISVHGNKSLDGHGVSIRRSFRMSVRNLRLNSITMKPYQTRWLARGS